MTDKNKLLEHINRQKPGTHRFSLMKIWPEIEEAINQKADVKTVWKTAKEVYGISCSYVWFTRFVKEMKAESPAHRTPKQISKAHEQLAEISSPPPKTPRTKADEEKKLKELF